MSSTSLSQPIGLTEFINQVKRELMKPESVADSIPLLAVEEVELELSVTVSKKIEGGLNIQVVQFGGTGERGDAHTVRVKLSPLLTREERVSELRKDPRWNKIVQQQVESTVKEAGQGSQKDQF